jgi:phosphatidylserine/phosphatidylglycerophosphate/cardiolipin synthase-like enzyme
MSKKQLGSIAAALLGLLVLGVFLLANFINPGAPTPLPEPTSAAGSWYQLYFNDPERTASIPNPTGGLPAAIIASFAEAQQTLDVAAYDLDYQPYADALIAAHQRGVRVRLVVDSDYLNEPPVKALRDAGIPIVDDRRDAFMHNKFVVIDGARIWTGSANFTFTDAYRNNNNMILIHSTRLAENYTAEFEQMFTAQDFGQALRPPNPSVSLSGALVENRFSPNAGVAAAILDVLKTARSSIHFMAFAFTREDFAATLIDRALAGVTVQGVFERRQIEAGADGVWRALNRAGLDVRQDGNPYLLHHKVFIVDQQIVVLGSYNFSRNAEEQNDENVLIIHDAEIAAAYYAEWQKVWAQAQR